MKCKVCGAMNEDYLEYCENCAALLTPDEPEEVPAPAVEESYVASTGETPPAWGFVRAPQWPRPEFDANTISEEDIPEVQPSRFAPRPQDVRPVQYSAPAPTDRGYTEGVRMHTPAASAYTAPVQQSAPVYTAPVQQSAPVYTAPVQQSAPVYVAPQVEEEPVRPYSSVQSAPAAPVKTVGTVSEFDEDYDDDDDYSYDSYSAPAFGGGKKAKKSKRSRSGGSHNALFIAAVAVLVVLIAVFSVIFLNKNYDGSIGAFFSCTFGGNPFPKKATITETTMESGDKAYIVTIYCKNNYTARFTSGETVKEDVVGAIARNCVAWRIPETIFVPDEPFTVSELRIKPDVVVISPKGEETPVEFENEIVIPIPAIGLAITSPTVSDFTTDTAVVPITGTVSDNTAAVFVNETQIPIDEAGNFSTSYTLPENGSYELKVEARKNRNQTATEVFNITYGTGTPEGTGTGDAPSGTVEGNVVFAVNDSVTRYGTTSTMTVSGTMEQGAVITVSGVELEGDLTQDPNGGTFSFTVKTPDVGLYGAVITATKDNAAKSSTFYLEHRPDKDDYMSGVHVLDYDRIKQYPEHDQGYKVSGKVKEIYQTAPFVTALISTDKGDIVFSYYSGVSEVATGDGKTYHLYADPAGTYTLSDGTQLPHMHAWFILKEG